MYSLVRKCTDPSNMMLVIISMWLARWISPSFRAYLQKAIDPYKDGIETILHIGIPIFLSAGTIGFVTWMIGSWLSGTTHRILEKIGDRIDAITWNINSQRLVFKGYSWALVWIVSSHVLGMNETFIYFLDVACIERRRVFCRSIAICICFYPLFSQCSPLFNLTSLPLGSSL